MNWINKLQNLSQKAMLMGGLFVFGIVNTAHAVSNSMAVVDDTAIGATSNYTFSFDHSAVLRGDNTFGGDVIVFQTGSGGPDFSNVSLVSLSGGTITGTITSRLTDSFNITLDGTGSVNPSTTITAVVSGVVNPGTVGQGPNYITRTVEFSAIPPIINEQSYAGTTYTSSNSPVVSNPIPDQNLEERNGAEEIVADLNSVFSDGDGDTLTFSIDPGHDTGITGVSLTNNSLTLTPNSAGTTTVIIRATSTDGTVTDAFDVSVIGELQNETVTPTNLNAGESSNYSISFTPDTNIATGQIIVINNSNAGGPNYSGASFVSINGGNALTAQFQQSPTDSSVAVEITGGSATTSDTVQIIIADVINPGAAGQGPAYNFAVFTFIPSFTQLAQGTAAGNIYEVVGEPTITAPIPDQNLNESLSQVFIINDLNTVFTDGNGDTLTFSIVPGHDTNIATASVNGNQLTVTPTGPGVTTVSVKASDLPGGEGEVVDSFDVSVIGLMKNASFTPAEFDTTISTSYELSFTTSTAIDSDYVIILANDEAGGPDYSSATLSSFTSSGLIIPASIDSQSADGFTVSVNNGSTTNSADIVISLNGVINPVTAGLGPEYAVRLFRIFMPTGDVEQAALPGHEFVGGLIFRNGFESVAMNKNLFAQSIVDSLSNEQSWMPQPSYQENQQHYYFMGKTLSRDIDQTPRSKHEVINWFHTTLKQNQPWDDWDNDGINNLNDNQPFKVNH